MTSACWWPASGLSFFYMGVHGKGVSLAPFKELPFRNVGWSCASEDCTMLRAAEGDVPAYVARVRDEQLLCRQGIEPSAF